MKNRIRSLLFGFALVALWLGYVAYTFSGAYRTRFEAKFNQVQVGDSYDRVVSLLGKPDYYCPLEQFVDTPTNGIWITTTNVVSQVEIYRVGTWDYGVEFPFIGEGRRGPVTKTVVSESKSICPGHDNKH
jgi:hypothetical protein